KPFYEALETARAIQAVVGAARPLAPADLLALDATLSDPSTIDDMEKEISQRGAAAVTALTTQEVLLSQEITKLKNQMKGDPPYDLKGIQRQLENASQFGVPGAIPF